VKLSEMPSEMREARLDYVRERWSQLADLEQEYGRAVFTYLMVVNSGGAAAVLSFMGAMKTTTPIPGAQWMLALYLLGVILVGVVRGLSHYRISWRYGRWRAGVQKLYKEEWGWEELQRDDESLGWYYWPVEAAVWGSFLSFLAATGIGALNILKG